ncbi:acyltransferase [Chitinivorax sp. PXF-14]|uniref:acyltransferase family protein n=1 Tax=Chitinivorax sp. PXF-14 TaxID=3230488 RepID=UPI003465FBFC
MPDRGMTRSFSLYLDLLRLLAALAVMVSHSIGYTFGGRQVLPISVGHNAVVVFFLLSGYVIAYVADHKENHPREFWISRLARIYSVALPAILLTPLADSVGLWLKPEFYAGGLTTHDYPLVRVAASMVFANELWLVSIMPFSNSPYWSLCYEMSYYLLFAIYTFAAGSRRWLWLGLAALVIGPKILLLAPIWALGVLVYRRRRWYAISEHTGWWVWSASLAGIAAFQYYDVSASLSDWTSRLLGAPLYTLLHFSKHFLADYLLGALIAANFVGFRRIAERFSGVFERIAAPLRTASSYTFSIYLFHLPIVFLCVIVLDRLPPGPVYFLATVACTLLVVLPLGAVTEQQKDRLKRWLTRRLPALGPFARHERLVKQSGAQ